MVNWLTSNQKIIISITFENEISKWRKVFSLYFFYFLFNYIHPYYCYYRIIKITIVFFASKLLQEYRKKKFFLKYYVGTILDCWARIARMAAKSSVSSSARVRFLSFWRWGYSAITRGESAFTRDQEENELHQRMIATAIFI